MGTTLLILTLLLYNTASVAERCMVDSSRSLLTEIKEVEHGESLTVRCSDEMELHRERKYLNINETLVFCSQGKWTPELPRCINKRCSVPNIANGQLYHGVDVALPGDRIASSETVSLECEYGYELYDELTSRYLGLEQMVIACDRGYFAPRMPLCKPKQCKMDAGRRLLPENSTYTESGANFTVTCPDRFELFRNGIYLDENKTMVSCSKGTWIPDLPRCINKRCSLPMIDNSQLRKGATMFQPGEKILSGEKAQLECNEGFELHNGTYIDSDRTDIECNEGSFMKNIPSCKEKRCQLDRSNNLLPQINYTESGSSLNVSCPENLELTDTGVSEYGKHEDIGESVSKQNIYVFCKRGTWTPKLPNCRLKSCKVFSPANGMLKIGWRGQMLNKDTYVHHNTQLMFSCDNQFEMYAGGYVLAGTVSCFDGSLIPGVPECRPRRCFIDPPLNLEYFIGGNKSLDGYIDNGTLMQAKCSDRMELVRSDEYLDSEQVSVICSLGTLEPESLHCMDKRCNITKIENGQFIKRRIALRSGEMIPSSSLIGLICADGFELYNETTDLYLESKQIYVGCFQGSFTAEIPTCKPKRCLLEPPFNLEYFIGANKVLGSYIDNGTLMQARCPDRMELVLSAAYVDSEQASVICNVGTLEPGSLDCKDKRCKVTELENGLFTNRGNLIDPGVMIRSSSNVRLLCANGYELYNERTHMYLDLEHMDIQCYQGSFTTEIPTCKARRCLIEPPVNLEYYRGAAKVLNSFIDNGTLMQARCPDRMELVRSAAYLNSEQASVQCIFGTLDPGQLVCKNKRCKITNIENGRLTITGRAIGPGEMIGSSSNIRLICADGYELYDKRTYMYLELEHTDIHCFQGSFTSEIPTCKPKRCKIETSRNLLTEITDVEHGTHLRIRCPNNMELHRESDYLNIEEISVFCSEGKWTPKLPRCMNKRCSIGSVENGQFYQRGDVMLAGDAIDSNETVTLMCKHGYEFYDEFTLRYLSVEQSDIKCDRGNFSRKIPLCKPKRCKTDPDKNLLPQLPTFYENGGNMTVSCTERMELFRTGNYLNEDNTMVSCNKGTWIPDLPQCINKRCKIPKVENGKFKSGSIEIGTGERIASHSIITLICANGYELYNERTHMYLDLESKDVHCYHGSFNDDIPTCKPKRCIIPTIRNSRVRKGTGMIIPGGKIVSGEKAHLECLEGFELHNGTYIDSDWIYITCNAGSFIENRPSCKEKRCQMDISSNLLPQIRFTESGSNLSVSCPDNMVLLAYGVSEYAERYGNGESVNKQIASVFCRNGRWTPDLPHCEIECEKPSSPENGKVYLTNNSLNVGSQIQYRCDEYHTMEPSTSQLAICTENGYWSTPKPRCIKMCKVPNLVGGITAFTFNGTEVPSDRFVLHNQIIVTVCSEGYRQQGTLTCNAGNWTGNSSCELEVCDKPNLLYTIVSRAILVKDDREFLHGTKLNASCESSSTLHNDDGKMIQSGIATTECIHGEWKPNFSCKKMCKPPLLTPGITGFMANGRNIKPEELFPHDERIKAVCSEGYRQQGTLTCNTGILKGKSICELEVCHEPSFQYTIVKHDKIENEDIIFSHGTKLNASCESSFTLMTDDDRRGNGKTECIHGEWEPKFSCKKKCTLPAGTFKFLRKMHLNESRKEGDQILHGKKMVSECESRNKIPLPSTCTNGTWVPLFKACAKDIPRCCVPNDPGMNFTFLHNGTVIEDRHVNAGDMVRVSCKFGYKTFSSPVTESAYEYDNYDVDSTADHAGEPKIMGSEKPKPASDRNYTCDESGNWVPEIRLTCKQINCDSLDDFGFDNGKIIYSTSNIIIEGTVASFTCHSGYRREGQENRTCQEDGTWSGGCVTCQKEKHNVSTTCLAPCVPDGARKTGSHSYEIGSRVEFHCLPSNTQYSGDSSNIRHCIHNGVSASWNGTQINCKGVPDVLLTKIAESFINDWRNLYIALGLRSEEVTVAADEPAMDAPLKILQYWRDNAMRGKPKSIIPQIIIALEQLHKRNEAEALRIVNDLHKVRCMRPLLNGSVKPMKFYYLFGESVTVSSCNLGYMLENQSYLVCSENETWFGNSACRNAICIPECGKNERCVRDNECQCAEGFSGKECDQEIIPKGKCPPLADPHRVIPFGVVNGKRYQKIEIKCNVSQAPFDDISQAVCMEGAWKPWKPYCQNTCILPSVPGTQYKYTISEHTAHPGPISSNRKIKVTCESGYFLRPGRSDVSTCDNGYWKPEILACEKIVSCTSPKIWDVSIQPSKKWYAVNETILLTGCQKGLELVGAKSLSCGTDGSWSGHAQCISYCQNGRTSWNVTSYKRANMTIIKTINYLILPSKTQCFDACKNVTRCKAVQLHNYSRPMTYCWLLPESTKDMPDGFLYQGLERVYDRVCDDACMVPKVNDISFHNGGFSYLFTKVQDGTVLSIKCKDPGQTAVPDKVTCMGGQWSHRIEKISCIR